MNYPPLIIIESTLTPGFSEKYILPYFKKNNIKRNAQMNTKGNTQRHTKRNTKRNTKRSAKGRLR